MLEDNLKNYIIEEEFVYINKRDLLDLLHIFNRVLLKSKRNLDRANSEIVSNDLERLYKLSSITYERVKNLKIYK